MECCGKCKHHKMNFEQKNGKRMFKDWICKNENSDYYGLETEYKDTCIDFEEKE